jgi:hypothetical protein
MADAADNAIAPLDPVLEPTVLVVEGAEDGAEAMAEMIIFEDVLGVVMEELWVTAASGPEVEESGRRPELNGALGIALPEPGAGTA